MLSVGLFNLALGVSGQLERSVFEQWNNERLNF